MALTNAKVKEILSAAGVSAENVEDAVKKIMEGHVTSINALREERDGYKADAEKLPGVQKELDDLKAKGDPDWQDKYEKEHGAFEAYKKQVDADKVLAQKTELYKNALKECNVGERQIANILKVSSDVISGLSIKDGKIADVDKLKETIKSEWAGFIMNEQQQGAHVDNPPANDGNGGKPESRAAKLAAQYHESLYGKKGD